MNLIKTDTYRIIRKRNIFAAFLAGSIVSMAFPAVPVIVQAEEKEATASAEVLAKYYERIQTMEADYGEPQIVEASRGFSEYLTGLCGTCLFDYNGDGQLDLLTVYSNNRVQDVYGGDDVPGNDGYSAEVWTWLDDKFVMLFGEPHIGELQDPRALDAGRVGDTNILVMENLNGETVIQLRYDFAVIPDSRIVFENYYWRDGAEEVVRFRGKDDFLRDDMAIPAEEWIREVTPARILYYGMPSEFGWFHTGTETFTAGENDTYESRLERPILKMKELSEALKQDLEAGHIPEESITPSWFRLISEKIMEANIINSFTITESNPDSDGWKYYNDLFGDSSLYNLYEGRRNGEYTFLYSIADIDKDGVPELIITDKNAWAETLYTFIFAIRDEKLVCIGELPDTFSTIYTGEEPGLLLEQYSWDGSGEPVVSFIKLTIEDGQLVAEDAAENEGYDSCVPGVAPGIPIQLAYPVL